MSPLDEKEPRALPAVECRPVRAGARLPQRMTEGAAGWDLHAALSESIQLEPGEWAAIPTGLVMEIPRGFEGVVRPRSGLAIKHGIGLVNAPGTIDSDYRGEVQVLLMNWGREPFLVEDGARVAQIVFQRVAEIAVRWGAADGTSDRGAGGFGHTGV